MSVFAQVLQVNKSVGQDGNQQAGTSGQPAVDGKGVQSAPLQVREQEPDTQVTAEGCSQEAKDQGREMRSYISHLEKVKQFQQPGSEDDGCGQKETVAGGSFPLEPKEKASGHSGPRTRDARGDGAALGDADDERIQEG